MEKTIKEINEFLMNATRYLAVHSEETKFKYAIKKVVKRLDAATEKAKDDYNEKLTDNNVSLASVDKSGNILYEMEIEENNGVKKEVKTDIPKYTPEKLKERNKLQNELFKNLLATEIEFEPYIATQIPELTEEETDNFKDFVL